MNQNANDNNLESAGGSGSDDLQHLVITCQEDPAGFREVYLLFIKPVFAYVLGLVRNYEQAEDITSETFIKAFVSISQLRNPEKFTAWIFTIARNKSMDFFRNQRRNLFVELEDDLDIETFSNPESISNDTLVLFKDLVRPLSEGERELILLKYYSGLTFKQISQVLKRPESTIKRDIYRTLRKMKAMLEDKDEK
jgi:RNA polymerase sigma-70 factor (ECF subfamily)